MRKYIFFAPPLLFFAPKAVFAHCPLCVAGAGILSVFAAYLGVSPMVVGVLLGAFALALGLWIAMLVKKEYVLYQRYLITAVVFLTTIVPIAPLVDDYGPLYIALWGPYGTLFHDTYVVNLFLMGVALGAIVVALVPAVSRMLTHVRGVQVPFQGTGVTLVLLVFLSLLIQFWPW